MKKLFEKHSIFKLLVIFILLVTILAWTCNLTYFQEGQLIEQGREGLGYFDIFTAVKLAGATFFETLGLIMAVYALYKVLGSTKAYQDLTDSIAKKVNTNVLMVVVTALIAVIASVVIQPIITILFIPFILSIYSKAKVDKVASIATTFGATMIGTIASTYSSSVAGVYKESLEISLTDGILVNFALLAVLVVVMSVLVIKKNKGSKDAVVDTFALELEEKPAKAKKVKGKKSGVVPMIVALALFAIVSIIAFIPWQDAFNVSVFSKLHDSIVSAKLFGDTIFNNILGTTLGEFGNWSLTNLIAFIVLFILIIKIIYRISFDKILDLSLDSIKDSLKPVILVALSYTVLVIALSYPVLPGLLNKILDLCGLNFVTIIIVGLLTGLFVVDPYYTTAIISGGVIAFESSNVAALALQGGAGLASLFAPTSILMILGLSMFKVEYKDWMKFIWKFLIAATLALGIVVALFLYI